MCSRHARDVYLTLSLRREVAVIACEHSLEGSVVSQHAGDAMGHSQTYLLMSMVTHQSNGEVTRKPLLG